MLNLKKTSEKRWIDFAMKADDIEEDGSFVCYGAVFDNVDQGGDVIAPGAFATSLEEAKSDNRLIPMLWQHDRTEPIGGWSKFEEDDKGLKCYGQIEIDAGATELRAYKHLKKGNIGGFSIGYRLKEGGYSVHPDFDEDDYIWLLSDVDLREVSLVTMPMNLEARLVSIKNAMDAGGTPTAREFETLLRDACGFTRKTAKEFTAQCRPLLDRRDAALSGGKSSSILEAVAADLGCD